MEITSSTIKQRLLDGWELRDHGKGWFLFAPRRSYQPKESYPVSRDLVEQMEKAGELSVSVPYTAAIATLPPAGN
jgi:hypothetical protein